MPMPDGTARSITLTQPQGCIMKDLSVKQFKKYFCNSTAEARAVVKFEKALGLKGKELRKMSDSWDKRNSNNAAGFYDAGKARAIKRGAV